ncbi:hypothetical protein P4114_31755 [Pseudomonas aeruginosa]|nr:hypothetical protein [Pseudomonas aeruginosa]
MAIASREALMGLSNGKRLATAMALYLPARERALIEAGEMSGNLVHAAGDAVSLVEARARIPPPSGRRCSTLRRFPR